MFNKPLNLWVLFGSSWEGQAGRRWRSRRKGMNYFQQILGRSVDVQCFLQVRTQGEAKTCFQKLQWRKEIVMVHVPRGALIAHGSYR